MNGVLGWWQRFRKRQPNDDEVFALSVPECEAVLIGELEAVMYRVEGIDKPFFHRFNKNDRPLMLLSADGSSIFVAQGSYRFGVNGFEG